MGVCCDYFAYVADEAAGPAGIMKLVGGYARGILTGGVRICDIWF